MGVAEVDHLVEERVPRRTRPIRDGAGHEVVEIHPVDRPAQRVPRRDVVVDLPADRGVVDRRRLVVDEIDGAAQSRLGLGEVRKVILRDCVDPARRNLVVRKRKPRGGIPHDDGIAGEIARQQRRRGEARAARPGPPLDEALIVEEEESLVAQNGSADGSAELILPDRALDRVEGVARVELVVAQEFVRAAVERVGAGLGDDVYDRASRPAIFGVE